MDLIIIQSPDALLQSQKTLVDFSTFDPAVVIQLAPKVKRSATTRHKAGIERNSRKPTMTNQTMFCGSYMKITTHYKSNNKQTLGICIPLLHPFSNPPMYESN